MANDEMENEGVENEELAAENRCADGEHWDEKLKMCVPDNPENG